MLDQAFGSQGLWLPCATAFYLQQGSNTALTAYLADVLRADPNLILPTAKWGAVRVFNIDIVHPPNPASIVYRWELGEFSSCSDMCGGGTQRRMVACIDNFNNPAEHSSCLRPEPPVTRCVYACAPGPWPGLFHARSRDSTRAQCVQERFCSLYVGAAQLPVQLLGLLCRSFSACCRAWRCRACQTQSCQSSKPAGFVFTLGDWGTCNATCGYGVRTRTMTCVSVQGFIGALSDCKLTTEGGCGRRMVGARHTSCLACMRLTVCTPPTGTSRAFTVSRHVVASEQCSFCFPPSLSPSQPLDLVCLWCPVCSCRPYQRARVPPLGGVPRPAALRVVSLGVRRLGLQSSRRLWPWRCDTARTLR